MKVYIVESHDDWNDSHYILDVWATKEAAVANLMEYNDGIVYDERRDQYKHSDPDITRYYEISEHDVRN